MNRVFISKSQYATRRHDLVVYLTRILCINGHAPEEVHIWSSFKVMQMLIRWNVDVWMVDYAAGYNLLPSPNYLLIKQNISTSHSSMSCNFSLVASGSIILYMYKMELIFLCICTAGNKVTAITTQHQLVCRPNWCFKSPQPAACAGLYLWYQPVYTLSWESQHQEI